MKVFFTKFYINRQADLISVASATNIHNTKFDDPAHPVAPGGVLDSSIKPATYVSFVDYLDDAQLARFGVHNGMCDGCYSLVLYCSHQVIC
jgi:hypothetical protein